jgi:hypothetical protein
MLKIRREGREQKKNLLLKQQTPFAKPLPTYVKPSGEPAQDSPEWLIGEDWALLQVSILVVSFESTHSGLASLHVFICVHVIALLESLAQDRASGLQLLDLFDPKPRLPGCKAAT